METAKKQTVINRLNPSINYGDPKSGHHYCKPFDIAYQRDKSLTHSAREILTYLLSNSDEYVQTVELIAYNLGYGDDTVKKSLKNLTDNKYLSRTAYKNESGKIRYTWIISAYKDEKLPDSKFYNNLPSNKPQDEKPTVVKASVVNRPQDEKPTVVDTKIDEPQMPFPTAEKPTAEKPTAEKASVYNNNKIINNEISIINTDKNGDTSMMILDKKSFADAQIFYSENFAPQATQNVPQPDNVIFEKIKAESKIIMKDSAIENENNKLNESDTAMKIKLNDNEYFETNDMFVDEPTAIKIENENLKLNNTNASTAFIDSAQENIDNNNDSVHSEIDVITPNIEEDVTYTKDEILSIYGGNFYDILVQNFGIKDIYSKSEIDVAYDIDTDNFFNC